MNRIVSLFLGLFVLALDFASKWYISSNVPLMRFYSLWYPYGGIGVFKNFLGIEFSIVHTTNKGAAWGMFAEYQEPLLWLRIILITFLLIYLLFFNKAKGWTIPVTLIVAGALGNVIDYFIYGHVIDIFHFILWGYDFPVFNVADSVIFIGVCWLFILTLFAPKGSSQPKKYS